VAERQLVLVDAGPLAALLHRGDQYHAVCVEQAKALPRPFLTSWAVLAEVAWLVRSFPRGLADLLTLVESGLVTPLELDSGAASWMRAFSTKYQDLAPQLADLTLCYLAEREAISTVFTTDRRDFRVFRFDSGRFLTLLPSAVPG
jgi:predicted nucleic acid-binding protein